MISPCCGGSGHQIDLPSSCEHIGRLKTVQPTNVMIQFRQPVYDVQEGFVFNDWECQLPLLDHLTNKVITVTSDGSPLPANITKLNPVEVRVSLDSGKTWHYKVV